MSVRLRSAAQDAAGGEGVRAAVLAASQNVPTRRRVARRRVSPDNFRSFSNLPVRRCRSGLADA